MSLAFMSSCGCSEWIIELRAGDRLAFQVPMVSISPLFFAASVESDSHGSKFPRWRTSSPNRNRGRGQLSPRIFSFTLGAKSVRSRKILIASMSLEVSVWP